MAAPALGSLIIGVASSLGHISVGYQGVFVAAAIFFLLGAVAVLGIREEAAELIIEQ